MRRTYISPEYIDIPVYGTYNMMEESNFFGAKMLEIEDSILISDQNIIYYQKSSGEQLDISIESSLPTQIYSSSDDMRLNHVISLDDSQTNYQKENNTKWIIDIDVKQILIDYLFAIMKRYRTFEGMVNSMTIANDVNTSIKTYISNNVFNRYKFSRIDLYLSYKDIRNENTLRYNNTWNPDIISESNKVKKIQVLPSFDGSELRVLFNQEKISSQYNFDYYFCLFFEKI